MKALIAAFLLIPVLSFGQLSKKEKKSIGKYADNMCECVNDLMGQLEPKVLDVIVLMAEKGEDKAMEEVTEMMNKMTPTELERFLDSFKMLEDPTFIESIDNCEDMSSLDERLKAEMNAGEGDGYDYFMEYIGKEDACQLINNVYKLEAQVSTD